MLYWGGLRLSEALALALRDVDQERGLNVRHGKGDRQRTAGLNASAQPHLERWFELRRRLGVRARPVFSRSGGVRQSRRLSPRYVQAMLARLGRRAGIEKRVQPHGLRHSHAVELVRGGVGVELIRRQLGHSSLASTQVYLQGLGVGEHVNVVQSLAWSPQNS